MSPKGKNLAALVLSAIVMIGAISARADERSPAVAAGLSFAPFLLGAGMVGGGLSSSSQSLFWSGLGVMIVGPIAGHIYADSSGKGMLFTLLRAVTVFAPPLIGVSTSSGHEFAALEGLVIGALVGGIATTVVEIVDAVDAAGSARDYNASHSRFSLAPIVSPTHNGGTTYGGSLTFSFN